jgi:carboxypeptidase C (cathepsin A)
MKGQSMRRQLDWCISFAVLMFVAKPICAQQAISKPAPKPDGKAEAAKETRKTTRHVITIEKTTLEYQATAGTLPLKSDDGKIKANMFYVAYTKLGVKDLSKRPITFTFNGGPGSSSVWLHMGAFGPRRVLMKDNGDPLPPPYRLVDNEFTLLDLTDLVFIDPVTTGYSRPAAGQNGQQFHGVEEDIKAVGEFIRLYVTRNARWESPKFLAGESYGTTRAAGLSAHLQDQLGMNLNGVILVSAILNFQTARFDEGNDLPYILFLPTYTATAWYHKKLADDLQSDLRRTLRDAEKFAANEYALALLKGKLDVNETQQIARRLARYTGLSPEFIMRSNLRVPIFRFTKELLRSERRSVGRFDSRFKGIDREAVGDAPDYDPSYAAVQGTYTATLNQYLRKELQYESDLPYEILTGRVQPWNFGGAGNNRYLNVSGRLRQAMVKNPDLRVFVANGYYDLATPYFATEYTFNHLGVEPSWAGHVTMGYYEAGHMMYVHRESHVRLRRDLARFYANAVR